MNGGTCPGRPMERTVRPSNPPHGIHVTPDDVVITVNADVTPPELVLAETSDEVWPPNHKLHAYDVADLVESVSDDCTELTASDVVFGRATSDEADDDRGDGATNDDVQFSDECRRAHVRSERSGTGDGRDYELVLSVSDEAGNTAEESFSVDLGVVAQMAHRVEIIYAGRIVETGTAMDIFKNPQHPYTYALLRSIPSPTDDIEKPLYSIAGSPPDLFQPPAGCAFAARCTYCMKVCEENQPLTFQITQEHSAACWLLHPKAPYSMPTGRA